MMAIQTGSSADTREYESTFSVLNPASGPLWLGSALQVTVDMESLISYFAGELKEILACEGIEYINERLGIHIVTGELRRHRCAYRMKTHDRPLGLLVLTRGKRFNKAELSLLELLLGELFMPLQRALARHERTATSASPCAGTSPQLTGGRSEHLEHAAGMAHGAAAERSLSSSESGTGGLTLAPRGPLGEQAPVRRAMPIDTSHLSLGAVH
jgi:hypothetical protein